MRLCSQIALSSVSVVALAAAAGPAYAQAPVTPSEVEACANLPTQQERDLCVQGQAQGDEGIQETGELATLPAEEAAELQAESDTIVVTGSRLRRSPFNSPDPLTVIDPELSMQEGDVETAEILQNTPIAAGSTQITSFLSSNFVTNGGPGAQTLSLRGLGAERTLVLLDGRRAGPAGVRGAVAAFDLNVLPSSIVRSVEIVKTGASSIYGSDAIAGVVNILTKRETKGLELTGFASLPSKSGGETFDASATYGRDFGRGHFLVSASYFRRNELERRDRDFLGCTIDYSFNAEGQRNDLQDPRTGEPYCGGDAFHNAILLSDFIGALGLQTNLTAPPGTQFPISLIQFNDPGSQTDVFGFPIRPRFGPSAGFQFEAPPGFFGVNVNSNSTGILNLFNESTLQQGASVIPKTDRFTLFGTGSYELTDSVELFADLLYNKRKTKVDSARQLFPQQFTGRTILPQFFCARIPGTTMDDPNDNCFPTDTGDPINSAFRGEVVLTPVIMVPFNTAQEVDYYRGVGGLRGEVNLLGDRPWRWEGWVQHARSDGDYESDIVFQDAFDTFNLRTRSCAGTTTRIRGAPCVDVNFTDPRVLRGDFTDQERDFIFGRDAGNTVYKQWTGELSTTGDLFTLPGGPVQAAVGVHLRRDEIKDVPGEATRLGNSWGLTRADVTAGHAISKEVFGEVDVPLLTDGPIGTVSVSAAGRVTNYRAERDDGLSDKDNGNFTYKLGGNWRLNEFVRVRGTYGTSYRAPALFEQFLGNETGFQSQLAIDPCINWGLRLAQGTISQNLADNCAAHGVPSNYTGGGTSSALVVRTGGIGILDPETSRAITASLILTPPPIWSGMRFSLALDYFNIRVKGQIATLGATNIVSGCYTSEFFPDDPLCDLFDRVNDPGNLRDNQIIEVRNKFVNINQQHNRGIDFTARLNQELGSWGDLTFLGQATYQLEDTFALFADTSLNDNGEAGDPKWIADLNLSWNKRPFTVVYGLDYIGATSDRADIRRTLGEDECGTNAFRGIVCPDYRLERTFYHSASVTMNIAERYDFTIGMSNIFDTKPPRVSRIGGQSGGNFGQVPILGSQYDYLGRRVFANIRARFGG